jgi:hypothetical protein
MSHEELLASPTVLVAIKSKPYFPVEINHR